VDPCAVWSGVTSFVTRNGVNRWGFRHPEDRLNTGRGSEFGHPGHPRPDVHAEALHGSSQFGEAGRIRGDASRVERDPIGPRLDVGVRHERQARLPSTCIRAQSAGVSEGTGSVRQHRAAGGEPRNASRIGVTRTGPRRGSRSSGRTTLFPTQAFARGARGVLRAHLRRRRPFVQAGLRPGPLNAPTAEQRRGHAVERGRLVQGDKRARLQPMSTDTVPTVDHDHADGPHGRSARP
jgi:hypothetical protein